jgi:hypothetical protein
MRALTILFIFLYWVACSGFYFVAALAFVRIMGSLVHVPKGWIRNSLWLLMVMPGRCVVALFPLFLGLHPGQSSSWDSGDRLLLTILVSLCFVVSLIPASLYLKKHRDLVNGVLKK